MIKFEGEFEADGNHDRLFRKIRRDLAFLKINGKQSPSSTPNQAAHNTNSKEKEMAARSSEILATSLFNAYPRVEEISIPRPTAGMTVSKYLETHPVAQGSNYDMLFRFCLMTAKQQAPGPVADRLQDAALVLIQLRQSYERKDDEYARLDNLLRTFTLGLINVGPVECVRYFDYARKNPDTFCPLQDPLCQYLITDISDLTLPDAQTTLRDAVEKLKATAAKLPM